MNPDSSFDAPKARVPASNPPPAFLGVTCDATFLDGHLQKFVCEHSNPSQHSLWGCTCASVLAEVRAREAFYESVRQVSQEILGPL